LSRAILALVVFLGMSIPAYARLVINVASYGAACNGVTDDTSALQAASNAVPAEGATLLFPAKKTCLISNTIYLKSNTDVEGLGATILASKTFKGVYSYGNCLFENRHWQATTVTDTGITVNDFIFDYGVSGANGGAHAVQFCYASKCAVTNCTFQLRRAGDAVAGIGVRNLYVANNSAYDFTNCPYDFWTSVSGVKLFDNYAETSTSGCQMVNWNSYGKPGDVCADFDMEGNTLVNTGAVAGPVNIVPLTAGGTNENIRIYNNKLTNTRNVDVENNTLTNVAGGLSVLSAVRNEITGTPDKITFAWNTIVNPFTGPGNDSVIRMEATNSYVDYNTITGNNYTSVAIATSDNWGGGAFNAPVLGNIVTIPVGKTSFKIAAHQGMLANPMTSPQASFSNASFETPALPAKSYTKDSKGAGWIFGRDAGIATNGCSLGNAASPNGSQAAFLHYKSIVSQPVNFPVAGAYQIAFQASCKLIGAVQLYVDSIPVGNPLTPPTSGFGLLKSSKFNVTAGSHTVMFAMSANSRKNATLFLDEVTIY